MADPITLGFMALTAIGTGVSAMGTIASGKAAEQAGRQAQQAREFEALQQEQAAQESRAAAQRQAIDKRREGQLLLSRLQARAAASGGGADDPTVLDLGGGIAERGEYEALTEMYRGENRARGLEDSAVGSRMTGEALRAEGEAKKRASRLSAFGTLIGGATSMYGQYNKLPSRVAYG